MTSPRLGPVAQDWPGVEAEQGSQARKRRKVPTDLPSDSRARTGHRASRPSREDAGMLSGQLARRLVLGPGQRLVEDQGSGGDKGMV